MTKTNKRSKTPIPGYRIYAQYVLAGAALGLYYGIFHRSTMEPDYGMAVILAVLAGIITTVVMSFRKKKSFRRRVLDFLKTTAMFMAFLVALQAKPALEELGGRTLVIATMTTLGMIFGLILGVRPKPNAQTP
jgi:hypothetical protein